MNQRVTFLACLVIGGLTTPGTSAATVNPQFIAYTNFAQFEVSTGSGDSTTFTSPPTTARAPWDQLVLSWNTRQAPQTTLEALVRPLGEDLPDLFYVLGRWSTATNPVARGSVNRQSDAQAEVLTDVLALTRPARGFQVRLIFRPAQNQVPFQLEFVGVSLLDSKLPNPQSEPNRAAWGDSIDVPLRSQLDYPGGDYWCSPTTVSMALSYWSGKLNRPDLERDVPEVARGVFDPNWPGTGNWSFNVAYAGSFQSLRAYVARLGGLAELERWIDSGVPVPVSVSYSLLKGKTNLANGHLVVCVGFTETGDVIVNDPGTRAKQRVIVPRDRFARAWAHSHHTAYLIHPDSIPITELAGPASR